MSKWTDEQVTALAPDASSLKAGRGLALPGKWSNVGASEQAIWGECQGSGKDPYRTQIDLSEPAFKCNCPSHKFPCKHGLGLFFLYANSLVTFASAAQPEWVSEWLTTRAKRAETKVAKAEEKAEKPVDVKAQSKRVAKREENVLAGLQELMLRLYDLMRNGLSDAQCQTYAYWDAMAARMVDAQTPGLARILRQMPGIMATGDNRYERALQKLAQLHMLIDAYQRIDTLPPGLQEEIRSILGWTTKQEELFQQNPAVADQWLVLGKRIDEEDKLKVQRTWLYGLNTAQPALLLSFAAGRQVLDTTIPPGVVLDAEVVYFPSSLPIRVAIKEQRGISNADAVPAGLPSIEALYTAYGTAVSSNPWLESFPAMLQQVVVIAQEDGWVIRDEAGAIMPVHTRCTWGWDMLAVTGGHPCWMMGEWDGYSFIPLSVWTDGRITNFA